MRDNVAAACVDESDHLTLVNAGDEEVVSANETLRGVFALHPVPTRRRHRVHRSIETEARHVHRQGVKTGGYSEIHAN